MNLFETIETRHSARTFNGLKPDETILDNLIIECNRLSDRNNLPACFSTTDLPQIMIVDTDAEDRLGTYGVVKGARTYATMGYAQTHDAMLLAGFIFEKFILYCTANGINTCWIGGTFSQNDFRRAISHSSAQEIFPVGIISPLGHSTQKTRFAERMMRRFAKSNSRKPFDKLFTGIDAPSDALLANAGEDLKAMRSLESCVKIALEMVRLAPSSRNCQPWRAIVVRQDSNIISVDFRCITDNKFSDIDMGIALCHFFDSMNALGQYGNIILNTEKSRGAFSWIPELNR